jgi:hypothetical protein
MRMWRPPLRGPCEVELLGHLTYESVGRMVLSGGRAEPCRMADRVRRRPHRSVRHAPHPLTIVSRGRRVLFLYRPEIFAPGTRARPPGRRRRVLSPRLSGKPDRSKEGPPVDDGFGDPGHLRRGRLRGDSADRRAGVGRNRYWQVLPVGELSPISCPSGSRIAILILGPRNGSGSSLAADREKSEPS